MSQPALRPLASETDCLRAFIAQASYHLPVRVFQRPIVNATATARGKTWHLRAGITGQADAYAIVRGGGHVEIETKSARGQMRVAQLEWATFCRGFGIPHIVLRVGKGELPAATVLRWIAELRVVLPAPAVLEHL